MFNATRALWFRTLLGLVTSLLMGLAFGQGPVKEVMTLDPPQPTPNDGTIEVLEFFDYGCIHCANFEPALEAWVKKLPADVTFKRVPAGFGSGGIDSIPIFYTLEAMGQLERLHKKIFDAVFNERVILGNKPTLLKWLEKQGVDPKQYEAVEKSFSVDSKIKRGRSLAGSYKIGGTPWVVISGRVVVQQVGQASNFLATIDRLIAESRSKMTPAKTTAKSPASSAASMPSAATAPAAAPPAPAK